MTTLYKLTDKDGVTGANYDTPLQWEPGVTHEISAEDYRGVLCERGIIHAYESPLVAVFMNPIHASYSPARLWRCETDAEIVRARQLLCGTWRLTCVEELPLPEITTAARTRAAILCALEVCKDEDWREWASEWLSGEDRSAKSARRSAERVAANAAWWWAAAWAARAARPEAAARAAEARAADWAAVARPELDLHAIIERAIREEQMDQERKQFCCKEAAAFQSVSDELQKLRSENEALRAQISQQGQKAGLPHLERLGSLFADSLNNTAAEMRFDNFLAALIRELES